MATAVSDVTARAWFFALCVAMVLIWAPSILLFRSVDTWQLVINTSTTIVTFLLVALLQNTQRRSDRAVHAKLDALAEGLADLMEAGEAADPSLVEDVEELRLAVGIEHREGT
jgi:low affinity Fe/Cu permease